MANNNNDVATREDIREAVRELHNDILNFKDEVLTEIKAMREDFTAHFGRHERHEEALDDHEERITTLEKTA